MGFHYAREKQKFDVEWERLSAWYQAEGMSAEAIEAIRQFDWANFCHQRVYEHWTTAFPEDTYVEDSKVCTHCSAAAHPWLKPMTCRRCFGEDTTGSNRSTILCWLSD